MRITGNDHGTMNTLKKSQTGRKLLQEAEKRGVNIQFKPDNGDSTMGQYNPNTKTITVEHGSIEKMTEVLAHELVHAATPENGNSMKEEKMAFIIGEKVASEAGVNFNPNSESYWNNHVNSAYSGLKNDNGIMNALSALDLAANQATAANTATPATNATNNADTATNATNTANTAANATPAQKNNPFDIANNNNQQTQQNNPQNAFMQMMMQFFMMMMQMMMQMMQQQPGNKQNQQQNTEQNAQLNPFAFQALNVSA